MFGDKPHCCREVREGKSGEIEMRGGDVSVNGKEVVEIVEMIDGDGDGDGRREVQT